ncbi:MAG: hypothetical protein H3C62_07620, partial [Gemmatimonadaceae bacterium]|nr:hypothetical protein [Gemmatimonadaceae bacterium]
AGSHEAVSLNAVKRTVKEPVMTHDMPGMEMPGAPKKNVAPPKKDKPDTMPPMAGMKHPNG